MKTETIQLVCAVNFEAAADDSSVPAFSMEAYTGAGMWVGFDAPVYLEVSGYRGEVASTPILRGHDANKIVGHTTRITAEGKSITAAGLISGANEHADEVVRSSKKKFPWQASVGASIDADRFEYVKQGAKAKVNGEEIEGPAYIAREFTLREISFVPMGADNKTTAKVAAQHQGRVEVMDEKFKQWLEAKDFDPETLSEGQIKFFKASFDAEETGKKPAPKANDTPAPDGDPIVAMRAQAAAESERIALINAATKNNPEIAAEAIREGWTPEKAELAVLRASRPERGAPSIHVGAKLDVKSIEAAVCMTAGISEGILTKDYDEKTLDAAAKLGSVGLRDLVGGCARIEGKHVPAMFGDGEKTIEAGFSTMSLPSILENVMGKVMLEAFTADESIAMQVCKLGSVSDFKQVTRNRLLGTGGFGTVGAQGELPNGVLTDEKFTNQADTHGQVVTLSRKDVINDDLGALMDVPKLMGGEAHQVIDHLFFKLLLANTGNFFHSSNNNLISSGGGFGSAQLSALVTKFRKIKAGPASGRAKDQRPVNIRPKILLTSVEDEFDAENLIGSAVLRDSSVDGKPDKNPHHNKYKVMSAPHLSDTYYTGNSATAFYLFADPRIHAAYELVFLNGRRAPTIKRVPTPANVLGMSFQGYIDVGVNSMDPRAAAKHTGEA